MLVGEGALRFARAMGFRDEDLLTEKSRLAWLVWKQSLRDRNGHNNWTDGLDAPPQKPSARLRQLFPSADDTLLAWAEWVARNPPSGTINCLTLNDKGEMSGVTTTSGLAWKIPGRVGDSPIIGAGLYVDNAIGAAGSTGFGEANLRTCGSFQVVQFMEQGFSPEESCLKALQVVAEKSKLQPRLLNEDGLPNFGHSFYALNKKGEYCSASMWSGSRCAVNDVKENRLRDSAYLFKRKR